MSAGQGSDEQIQRTGTVHATGHHVQDVISRIAANDESCTSVKLTLLAPYDGILNYLADAIRENTVLTSLGLEVADDGDTSNLTIEGSPFDKALLLNTAITVLTIKGVSVPNRWERVCARNTALATAAPPPVEQLDDDDETINLEEQSWSRKAGNEFSIDTARVIGHGSEGAVLKVSTDGGVVAAKTHHALQNPKLFGLEDPQSRDGLLKACMREVKALMAVKGHKNIIELKFVAWTKILDGVVMPTYTGVFSGFVGGETVGETARRRRR